MINVLIVDDIHQVFMDRLSEAGINFSYFPAIGRTEALKMLKDYEVLVVRSKFKIDEEVFSAADHLSIIARAGAGMDNIDEQLAEEYGVRLINAPEGNRDAVGEHMIGMLLSMLNNLSAGDKQVRGGIWLREQNRGVELGGKTVALIGYGNNGQAMARKLSGFGVNVIAYDKYKTGFSDQYAKEVSMEEVVRDADILSLHIPLTRETHRLVDAEYLLHFKKPIFFLNGARGEIVDIMAVLDAIDHGKILGAAFDVLPLERFPEASTVDWFERLSNHEGVLLTPHVAGWSVESYFKIAAVLADKLISHAKSDMKLKND
ncbi:phosphoglycerate dehydrogenase [Olivibacter sp. SDN3]|uniref:NAD(P)-dependent oxidoreductase n=1 Tax=Olivibacter sp. SDN3 TaxID=2764720 RepID=UPI001651019B|nr:NAD(P)-dependent oxidoreductase [Olivibacter sp. SDN3]QNL50070.1 phosphoglycerate dehydrogenase [Olivibacter sp. SDN3]